MKKHKKNIPHILNTSATLLGLCFVVLTSFKINKFNEGTIIDELTSFAIIMFLLSCVFSYLSIRSANQSIERFEKLADIVFLLGLFLLFVITMLITFNFIKQFYRKERKVLRKDRKDYCNKFYSVLSVKLYALFCSNKNQNFKIITVKIALNSAKAEYAELI